jgi:hypothetical protein
MQLIWRMTIWSEHQSWFMALAAFMDLFTRDFEYRGIWFMHMLMTLVTVIFDSVLGLCMPIKWILNGLRLWKRTKFYLMLMIAYYLGVILHSRVIHVSFISTCEIVCWWIVVITHVINPSTMIYSDYVLFSLLQLFCSQFWFMIALCRLPLALLGPPVYQINRLSFYQTWTFTKHECDWFWFGLRTALLLLPGKVTLVLCLTMNQSIRKWRDNWLEGFGPLEQHATQIIPEELVNASVADMVINNEQWSWESFLTCSPCR